MSVALVGAGPGDPELITVGGLARVCACEVLVYDRLVAAAYPDGEAGDVRWNFEKFVVGRSGAVVARFVPKTPPDDPAVLAVLEDALAAPVS